MKVSFFFFQKSVIYYRGIWHAIHTICREEGFIGLYRGLGATLLVSFYFILLFLNTKWLHTLVLMVIAIETLLSDAGRGTQYSNQLFCF